MCVACVGASNKSFFGIFAHWGKALPALPSAGGRPTEGKWSSAGRWGDHVRLCTHRSMNSRYNPGAVRTARTARSAATAMLPRATPEESSGLSPDVDDPPLSPTVHDVALPVWPRTRTSDSAHGLPVSQLSHQPRLRLASSARETPKSVDGLRAHAYHRFVPSTEREKSRWRTDCCYSRHRLKHFRWH